MCWTLLISFARRRAGDVYQLTMPADPPCERGADDSRCRHAADCGATGATCRAFRAWAVGRQWQELEREPSRPPHDWSRDVPNDDPRRKLGRRSPVADEGRRHAPASKSLNPSRVRNQSRRGRARRPYLAGRRVRLFEHSRRKAWPEQDSADVMLVRVRWGS